MSYAYYPTGNVKTVRLGNNVTIDYTYHISGAVKTATAKNADGKKLFEEELYYEDCGNHNCVPQYNGNISYMVHELAANGEQKRSSKYVYDFMNRLTSVEDSEQDMFNEYFKYDEQGRIVSQRRGQGRGGDGATGGEYGYYANTNRLEKVSGGMGGMSAANRDMSAAGNFVYDSEGNLIEDRSKNLKISYDWRGMPVEFRMESKSGNVLENTRSCSRDSVRVLMAYDGSGRRVSKTRERKACISETSSGATSERTYAADWERELVTHYTGIGTEVRESFHNGTPSETKVVVNMPQGLGRYGVEDATDPFYGVDKMQLAGYIPSTKFEWFLKNHLGSTMLVYGTSAYNDTYFSGYKGGVQAAYDYRAFGEQVSLMEPADKVTETFTGKELDDETELNYFGARYLDPMLGLWTSVDPMREYHSPYIYLRGNPINLVDPTGMAEASDDIQSVSQDAYNYINNFKPTEKEISTFIETYDKFEGLTPKLLKGILENMYVQYEDNPRSETANGYYYPGDDREIYLTDRALNTKDSDWQMRIRSTIFHETAHYLNGLYGSINDGQKPYPDEKYQKKGFNGGSVELGKEFEYRAYGKDY
ncbi:RHS repeat-associated core domain-containing protein [Fibrobacter sp. HC4]|uniref:RHS repeat-associated core domain-containing protein n=1 Tax=Fibrobacter sp. HC4 TaxID=3239812 RepID=UPI002019B3E8|nr:hypothetical protein [Fibrobacter succinogenes]